MKKLFILFFIFLLAGCGDPEVKDLKNYITKITALHTHLRAAESIYDKQKSKSELALAGSIKKRILMQYVKYKEGLVKLQETIKTPAVEELNQMGIKSVTSTIDSLSRYQKLLLERDTHSVIKARTDTEAALRSIETWQTEIKYLARENGLSFDPEAGEVKKGFSS